MLPTEILLTIFKILYMQNRDEVTDEREFYFASGALVPEIVGEFKCIWRRGEELRYPSLFPYSIASVCARWRAVASSVPAFWTRVVFFLDSGPEGSSLADLERQLEWSRDLPLEVTLGRMNLGDDFQYDMEEAARVRSAMELLLPHISRWHMLYISTIRSSSLPVILKELRGTAPILRILRLECDADDADNDLNVYDRNAFICPAVHNIDIDGANLLRLRNAHGEDWATRFVPQLEYLGISFLSAEEDEEESSGEGAADGNVKEGEGGGGAQGEEGIEEPEKGRLGLDNFLGEVVQLTSLRQLILKSIFFIHPMYRTHLFPPTFDTLVLEDLSVNAVFAILFNCIYPGLVTLKLVGCPIHTMLGLSVLNVPCLVLQDLDPSTDPMKILVCWQGIGLEIIGCPSFNDITLAKMSGPRGPGCCIHLQELALFNCTKFSVSALQEMVKKRLIWDRPIQILNVAGEGPAITDDERAWFGDHVADFSYEVVPADPERHE